MKSSYFFGIIRLIQKGLLLLTLPRARRFELFKSDLFLLNVIVFTNPTHLALPRSFIIPYGSKGFFSRRDEKAKERRHFQRQKNGYVPGAHKEDDAIRHKDRKLPKTKDLQLRTLDLWVEFIEDPENGFDHYKTAPGCQAPSHETVKGFIRWYAESTKGRLDKSGKPTVRTTKSGAEKLFGGLKEATSTDVSEMDREEIYTWIKNTFTKDGKVVNKKKLKYKHIELVLFPSATAPWEVGWRVNQQWLKNNRDPDYTMYEEP